MVEQIVGHLSAFSKEIIVMIIAALPVVELRLAIPWAISQGIPAYQAYLLAVVGNIIPVIPILLLLQPVVDKFRHIPLVEKFFNWLFERTRKKAALVEKFEAIGLILFVAIPLPVTGAWTGCVAATLFKVRFRYALPAIVTGVIIAGLIVLGVSMAGKGILNFSA